MAVKKKVGKGAKGKERPPPVDKLIIPAIGIGLAILAFQFLKGIKTEVRAVQVPFASWPINYPHLNVFPPLLSQSDRSRSPG